MKGHAGVVLTAGLAAVALALALLQAVVVAHGATRSVQVTATRSGTTNRYSAPAGRSGVPWLPFEKEKAPEVPASPEGSKPGPQRQEEHHAPPPSRFRSAPPRLGPQRPRSAGA